VFGKAYKNNLRYFHSLFSVISIKELKIGYIEKKINHIFSLDYVNMLFIGPYLISTYLIST